LEFFNGSLANGKWNMSLSGTSRTEPAIVVILCNTFLTEATPGKQTDIRSCSAPC
jgi:hypothetical protein